MEKSIDFKKGPLMEIWGGFPISKMQGFFSNSEIIVSEEVTSFCTKKIKRKSVRLPSEERND